MRNMFAHDYGSMDIDKIYETALYDVPELEKICHAELHSNAE